MNVELKLALVDGTGNVAKTLLADDVLSGLESGVS